MARMNRIPNTLVVDPTKGWYVTHRDEPPGRRWDYKGVSVALVLQAGEEMVPIEPPAKPGDPPDKLYRAVNWPEAKQLFGMKPTLLEKLNIAASYGLIIVMFFFLFLTFASVTGG